MDTGHPAGCPVRNLSVGVLSEMQLVLHFHNTLTARFCLSCVPFFFIFVTFQRYIHTVIQDIFVSFTIYIILILIYNYLYTVCFALRHNHINTPIITFWIPAVRTYQQITSPNVQTSPTSCLFGHCSRQRFRQDVHHRPYW